MRNVKDDLVQFKAIVEMEAFDQLPPEIRRVIDDADYPHKAVDVLQQTIRIDPKYVADLLRAEDNGKRRIASAKVFRALGGCAA